MPVMYCLPSDIRANVAGTDAGTGTCAALSDSQLTNAIEQASAKVSAYAGTTYAVDAEDPVIVVPVLIASLTVQLATFYATLTYRKGKGLPATDPVYLGYEDAMKTLTDVVNGWIEVDPATPGEPIIEAGHVVQTIPAIFSWEDSGTVPNGRGGVEPAGAPGTRFMDGWR